MKPLILHQRARPSAHAQSSAIPILKNQSHAEEGPPLSDQAPEGSTLIQPRHLTSESALDHSVLAPLPPPENKRFYPALDGLRAVAVLLVFIQHYLAPFKPQLNWGWAGVDIFFVLSGFLITGILYDTRDAHHRFRIFYMRRTLRIFPLYYGVLFLALVTKPIAHWLWSPAWILWFLYLGNYARFFYLHSPLFPMGALEHLVRQRHGLYGITFYLGHFWSLCVEEQFYLVWPLVVFTVRRRETLRTVCLLSLPLVLAARIACVWLVPQPYLQAELLYRATPFRVDALLLGGFLALCLRGKEAAILLRAATPVLYSLIAGFVLFQLLYWRAASPHTLYVPTSGAPVLTTIGYTLIDLFAAALILRLLSIDNPLARILNLKPLRALGKISYGFYVFHDIFHNFYARFVDAAFHNRRPAHGREDLIALVAFLGTTLLAWLSFRFFETPFLRLKSRFVISPEGA